MILFLLTFYYKNNKFSLKLKGRIKASCTTKKVKIYTLFQKEEELKGKLKFLIIKIKVFIKKMKGREIFIFNILL